MKIPRPTLAFLAAFLALSGGTFAAPLTATANLAGGCFWTMQTDMTKMPGQSHILAGYTGGTQPNPTYATYHDGTVPHLEAVQVTYDPAKTSYPQLLDYYFHHVDATDGGGQFCDRGVVYRPAIFYANATEHQQADAAKAKYSQILGQNLAVEILPAQQFWPAEDYHQDYASKNPIAYHTYRYGCGKDARLQQLWSGKQ